MSETRVSESAAASPGTEGESPARRLKVQVCKRLFGPGSQFILDVEFQAASEFTILFGASGAGKTTLLDCVTGLIKPDSGSIAIGERVLFDAGQAVDVPVAKRRVGYVFQSLALFPHLTVGQNVAYGLAHHAPADRRTRVQEILHSFRISHLERRSARELSGGESQRVALARTLVTDPSVLLLDEPLAALDAPTKAKIIDDLREWNRSHRIPILYVTHSREEVFALGERVIVLDAGRIVAEGTPHEVMTAPTRETVAQLAGFENIFDAVVEAVRPERGTMTCRIISPQTRNGPLGNYPTRKGAADSGTDGKGTASAAEGLPLALETPLVRGGVGSRMRVGIRAGDILLATQAPVGLSARNVLPGRITSLEQRDVIVIARVNCRIEMEVHLTLAARDSLQLEPGKEVWLVIKTHSCHLMQG